MTSIIEVRQMPHGRCVAVSRSAAACLAVAATLVVAGCRTDPSREIEGEWMLQLTVTHTGGMGQARPGQQVQGTLVIDPRIPDAFSTRDEWPDSAALTFGRVYLDMQPLYDTAAAPRSYPFRTGMRHDIYEEAMARVDSGRAIEVRLAPSVTHYGITLRGTLTGGEASGRWIHDGSPGEAGPAGTFRMRRAPRGAMTDSALHRSRRAQREWEHRG